VCALTLTSRFNQIRETFILETGDCPAPFADARRWEVTAGQVGAGPAQIAFWSGGFRPDWTGPVVDRDQGVWRGEGSDGVIYVLRPQTGNALAWLRGEPQAARRQAQAANRLRRGDLLGLYQLSPTNGYPRECYLTLFRGPQGGGRIQVEGERCGPFFNADRYRVQQGRIQIADRGAQVFWSGDIRRPDGGIRLVGGDRDVGQWELNKLEDTLDQEIGGLVPEDVVGRWTFTEQGQSCQITLQPDGRVRPAFACEDPAQLFARWRLEGDLLVLSDSFTLSPSDLWRGRMVDLATIEGRGTEIRVGMPPRQIGRSTLRR
jgi:hypothetical protein